MTVESTLAPRIEAAPPSSGPRFHAVALIVFLTGVGYAVCVVANTLSRMTEAPPHLLFWAGLLLIAAPVFYRLTSSAASEVERLFLVCLLGGALYALKLARD